MPDDLHLSVALWLELTRRIRGRASTRPNERRLRAISTLCPTSLPCVGRRRARWLAVMDQVSRAMPADGTKAANCQKAERSARPRFAGSFRQAKGLAVRGSYTVPRIMPMAVFSGGPRGVDAAMSRYEIKSCAHAKAARDNPDGLPLRCVCVEVYCVERRRT